MEATQKICPRCGLKYSWMERRRSNGREYYYAVHVEGSKRRKCYLGPREYENVSRLHYDVALTFKGLLERGRAVDYLESLLIALKRDVMRERLSREDAKRLMPLAKELVERLELLLKSKEGGEEDVLSRFPPPSR